MNGFKGTLQRRDGRNIVEAQGGAWPLGTLSEGRDGQAVHYGVQPGDIHLGSPERGSPAKVVVVEPTVAETELVLEGGGEQLIMVLHGRTTVQPGEQVRLVIDGRKAHLFDDGSGKRLDGGRGQDGRRHGCQCRRQEPVGRLPAQALGATYLGGDNLRLPVNVARMADEAAPAFDLALAPARAQIVDRILQPEVVPHG